MNRPSALVGMIILASLTPSPGIAEEWCSFAAGTYEVISNGTKSQSVWLYGKFIGQSSNVWVPIKNASYGDSSVAIALAAQMAGKQVSVFVDGTNDTCANYVSWSGVIRHVKVDK